MKYLQSSLEALEWDSPGRPLASETVFQRAFHSGLSARSGRNLSLGCQIIRSQEPSECMVVSTWIAAGGQQPAENT